MDGFRALAILWVFLLHIWLAAGKPALGGGILHAIVGQGYLGVDVLFIVSGFVLFLPAAVNNGDLGSVRSYALRRVVRLVPSYFLALLVVLLFHRWIAPAAFVPMPWDGWHGGWAWLTHLLFIQTYTMSFAVPMGFGVLSVIWTLTVEMTFYLVLPFVAKAFNRHPFVWLIGALVAAEVWQAAITPGGMTPTSVPTMPLLRAIFSFPSYVGHFALGMAAAWLYAKYRNRMTGRPWFAASIAVQVATAAGLLAFFMHRTAHSAPLSNYLVERMDGGYVALLFAGFMLASALGPRWAHRPFSNPLIAGMGDASYGVYLTHSLLLGVATGVLGVRVDGSNDVFWQLAYFTMPPAIALGYMSCRFVEQPAREWARRRKPKEKVPDYPPDELVPYHHTNREPAP
jgi:acetyltransferase